MHGASRVAWILAGLALIPYAVPAVAIWSMPPAISALWALCLYAALVIGGVGFLRLRLAMTTGAAARTLMLALLSPLAAIAACAIVPWIGFRWAFALQVAALSVQGLWNLSGSAMPDLMRRMRPIVSGGGLVCLLIGLIGA